jgi:hypothetical protein
VDLLIAAAAISLGLILGWMVYRTFTRQQALNAKALGAIVSIMVGAGVLGIFQAIAGKQAGLPRELYWYPIGLLAGMILTACRDGVVVLVKARRSEKAAAMESDYRKTRDLIISHLDGKRFEMMSFENLREDLGRPDWTDSYFRQIISEFPADLRNATLKGNRPGVALVHPKVYL